MTEYKLIPARRVETEFTDQHSRFITNAAPAAGAAEAARQLIDAYCETASGR